MLRRLQCTKILIYTVANPGSVERGRWGFGGLQKVFSASPFPLDPRMIQQCKSRRLSCFMPKYQKSIKVTVLYCNVIALHYHVRQQCVSTSCRCKHRVGVYSRQLGENSITYTNINSDVIIKFKYV